MLTQIEEGGTLKCTRSKEIKAKSNHLVVTAYVNGDREKEILERAIKTAVKELKKLNDGGVTFETYINTRNSNLQGG